MGGRGARRCGVGKVECWIKSRWKGLGIVEEEGREGELNQEKMDMCCMVGSIG
jgi:hypothetical protein